MEDLDAFFDALALHRPARPRPGPSWTPYAASAARLRALLPPSGTRRSDLVNGMLAEASRSPSWCATTTTTGTSTPSTTTPRSTERIAVETAMAMVDVIRADEMSRLDVCADDGCDGVVLDLSRNRSRRYCSTACGNRNAVAAYRARRRPESAVTRTNRRSTSSEDLGCSECTQCPAPLTVTRRLRGNSGPSPRRTRP